MGQIVIALDTNLLLHFKYIGQLKPGDLAVRGPAKWLIVRTVEREVDAKKRDPRLGHRARQVDKWLDENPEKIIRFRAAAFDYAAHGLDPNIADDRVLADLLVFRENNRRFELHVVSDDGGFRRNASDFGFSTIAPSEGLRLQRDEDPVVAENRRLKQELEQLKGAAPALKLRTRPSPLICVVGKVLTPKTLEEKVRRQLAFVTSEDPPSSSLMGVTGSLIRGPNPNYKQDVREYCGRFGAFYSEKYARERRLVEIGLEVRNDGLREAEEVNVAIVVPSDVGGAYAKRPEEAEAPPIPNPVVVRDLLQMPYYSVKPFTIPPNLLADISFEERGPRIREGSNGGPTVQYYKRRLPQLTSAGLAPFFIMLSDSVRRGFQMSYEIRSRSPGVQNGTLDVVLQIDGAPPVDRPII